MNHTPGPWTVTIRDGKLHVDAHEGGFTVGRIYESASPTGEANARLVAAAPELLAFAKGELKFMARNRTMDYGNPPGYEALKELIDRIEGNNVPPTRS